MYYLYNVSKQLESIAFDLLVAGSLDKEVYTKIQSLVAILYDQFHDPAYRLRACSDAYDGELQSAKENGYRNPALFNSSCTGTEKITCNKCGYTLDEDGLKAHKETGICYWCEEKATLHVEDIKDNCEECEACKHTSEFSSSNCDLCNSPLGGPRHSVALVDVGTDTEPIYYSVCVDCMYYIEYGQLDDSTMLEIEDNE
jgi:hypothetical protein